MRVTAASLSPTLALALSVVLALSTSAPAVELEGALFPDQAAVGQDLLPLRGSGVLYWHHLVRVHAAALWLPAGAKPLDDVPKRLELHYFRAFTAADFRSVTTSSLASSVDAAELAPLDALVQRYQALYIDRPAGSSYTLTYQPGVGTTLTADGRELGMISGPAFAHALFSIWLGATAVDDGLRQKLLGE
jgi:hypothetical protein